MKLRDFIRSISDKKLDWKWVNDINCVHSFSNGYFVNLCFRNTDKGDVIYVEVDNFDKGQEDVIKKAISPGDNDYNILLNFFKKAQNCATESSLSH